MKECLNCGYERKPKEEGIIPATECPRCRVIYGKIKYGNESKRFPIPKVSIIRSAWNPFILTLPFIIGTVLQIMGTPEIIGTALLVLVFWAIIFWWVPFLRRPYEIDLEHKQLTFKALIRTVKVNVGDLILVKDTYGNFFTRFESTKKSVVAINIKEWDELIKIIKSICPAVEIKRASKGVRMITKWYYPLLVTMLICIFGDFVDLAGIHRAYIKTDLAPVIVALEKYKTENNHYPDKLEELTPVYLNYDPSPSSWYIVDSKHRFRADPGEYKLGRPYTLPGFLNLYLYNSRTKTWKGEN